MSWAEWEETSWWEQYSLIEGLRQEGILDSEQRPETADKGSLQGIGIKVRAIEGKADWADDV
jgi:hypothetical protein